MLNNSFNIICLVICLTCLLSDLHSQEDSDKKSKRKAFVSMNYHNTQNQIQTITVKGLIKSDNKLEPISSRMVKVYFDEAGDDNNFIGESKTDFTGKAVFTIPAQYSEKWNEANTHTMIAVIEAFDEFDELESEIEITKSKLMLDTLTEDDQKKISIKFYEKSDTLWLPVSDVEMKVGIRRLGSILPIGEDATFTTDSSGTILVDYSMDTVPGDNNGMIGLIAKVEEHELYGTVENELVVPWGTPATNNFNLDQRTLWATGNKVPIWLLSLALLIIVSVWGTLLYIVWQLSKIIKMGRVKT